MTPGSRVCCVLCRQWTTTLKSCGRFPWMSIKVITSYSVVIAVKFSECRQTIMTTNIVIRYRNSGVIVQNLVATAGFFFFSFLLPPMLTCSRSTCCSALHRASQYGNLQGRHHQVVLQPYKAGMHTFQLRWLPREWQQIQHWGAVHEFLPRRNRLVGGEQTLCTPACGSAFCLQFHCFILSYVLLIFAGVWGLLTVLLAFNRPF